jgi:protein O-mannosyl-transferase
MTIARLQRWSSHPWLWVALGLLLTVAVYAPGLTGGWLFDDFPNIVENPGVHPSGHDLPSLFNAALSSPASDFKRPLASLSFALNYLTSGLDPYPMKVTNLVIHLANGLLVFLLLRAAFRTDRRTDSVAGDRLAALIATAWLLLPINLTAVLYVVQRMESLANFFVLLGLLAYVHGRTRMMSGRSGLTVCMAGVLLGTGVGALAKETAVMLPLYAFLSEIFLFRWRRVASDGKETKDTRLIAFFLVFLALPMVLGSAWLAPKLLNPASWVRRDFTLGTRLLSEARIVVDYIGWTLFPTPQALSFYHDGFEISRDLLHPWTTLTSIVAIGVLVWAAWIWRYSRPLAAMGIGWYLGCHLLTSTVLPLELVYEHRNYFASIGVLVTVFVLAADALRRLRVSRPVVALITALFIAWQAVFTLITAQAWGDPLALARELALREPDSPRSQYELGRTYIIYSRYEAGSPFIQPARIALERASRLPGASILPEQALIFMNSRMRVPVESAWWTSMEHKLAARPPTVQDESSLEALSSCLRETSCDFPTQDLLDSYLAALSHPQPSARLLGMYANFAWNSLNDRPLGIRIQKQAVAASPGEAAYRIGLARMAIVTGDFVEARTQIDGLRGMNIGRRLDKDITPLSTMLADAERTKGAAAHD